MTKRIAAFALSVFVLWNSSVSPARAFAPVAVLAAPQVVAVGGEIYAMAALAGAVGLVGLYTLFEDSEGNQIRIPLSDAAEAQPPEPDASATATPNSGYQSYTHSLMGATNYGSYTEACSARITYLNNSDLRCSSEQSWAVSEVYCTETAHRVQYVSGCNGSVVYEDATINGVGGGLSCPSGYVLNGGVCQLIDARQAQPDKKLDYKRENGSYVPASPNDADTTGFPSHQSQNNAFAWAGKTMYGEPYQSIQTMKPDGSSIIETQIQRESGVVEVQRLHFSPNGHVIGFSVTETSGSLQVNPDTGTATVVATQPITNPDGSANTSVQPSTQPSIKFPSDYARDVTVDAVKQSLQPTVETADPVLPETMPDFGETFVGLTGWHMPAHTSTCPVGNFDWNGGTYAVDTHCQLVSDHWATLQAAMAVVWMVAALFVVLRA